MSKHPEVDKMVEQMNLPKDNYRPGWRFILQQGLGLGFLVAGFLLAPKGLYFLLAWLSGLFVSRSMFVYERYRLWMLENQILPMRNRVNDETNEHRKEVEALYKEANEDRTDLLRMLNAKTKTDFDVAFNKFSVRHSLIPDEVLKPSDKP